MERYGIYEIKQLVTKYTRFYIRTEKISSNMVSIVERSTLKIALGQLRFTGGLKAAIQRGFCWMGDDMS